MTGMTRDEWDDDQTDRDRKIRLEEAAEQQHRAPHWMIPGSHERPGGPECLCGAPWDRSGDHCGAYGRGAL